MKTNHLLLAMTFTSLFMFGTSLYGQQDVDPTWYDPCPSANQVTAPSQTAKPMTQTKTVSSLPEGQSGKLHAKRLVNQASQSPVANGHKVAASREQQLSAKNVPSTSIRSTDEQRVYSASLDNGRDAVPASRMADEAAIPIAIRTTYAFRPTPDATR